MIKKIKKLVIYIILVIVLVKSFGIVFKNETKQVSSEPIAEYKKFDYGDYTNIKLLHADTGEVEDIAMDMYLYGVVSAEMPANYELEALKAQAVVARTYTIYKIMKGSKHADQNADICTSANCCQAWISKENRLARWEEDLRESNWLKIENAVNSTIGKVILYEGQPINAFFHSNSGGSTEVPENVWGGSFPYFQTVETAGEDAYTSYNSEVELTKDELNQKMHDKYSSFQINYDDENVIQILDYTDSGRVKNIKIGNIEILGTDCRNIFGLRSAKFGVSVGDTIKFTVTRIWSWSWT